MAYSEGEAVFFKKVRATLKYGLHWDAVISRWARELANEVGVLEITKNIPNLQVFGSKNLIIYSVYKQIRYHDI